ncbi:MAG: response regulator [Pirellulales bacterium]
MSELPVLFIVDDDPAVCDSLTELAAGLNVETECHYSAESFRNRSAQNAQVASCSTCMPGLSGLELQQHLTAQGATTPVIFLTGHGDIPMSVRAMKQGATHFLEKPFPPDQLTEAIREALEIDNRRRDAARLLASFHERISELTEDELCVLKAIARGRSNPQIAKECGFSPRTAQFRRASLMKKLHVANKAELMDLLLGASWSPFDDSSTPSPD